MMKHLQGGVKKGAFDEAAAQAKFEAWKNSKVNALNSIKTKDEQAKAELKKAGFEAEKEANAAIAKKVADKKAADVKSAKETAAVDAAVANATMEIPAAMIETQQRQMVDDFAQRLQMQGLSLDQYFQFTGLTASAMMDQVKPQAENRIKSSLVLEAIVKAEGIVATEEDFTAEVAKMAEQYKMEVTAIEEMIGEAGKKQIMNDLAIAKAVEFVVANAVEK
jgi:trigger factor